MFKPNVWQQRLCLDVTIDAKNVVFVNLCNPNTGNVQAEVLNTLLNMMKVNDINKNPNLLLGGNFNVIFNTN